jgi:hypothetical protein
MPAGSDIITGKNFDSPDESRRPFEKGRIDVLTIGDLTFYRETLEPGWQWSEHVKPIVGGESCQRFSPVALKALSPTSSTVAQPPHFDAPIIEAKAARIGPATVP